MSFDDINRRRIASFMFGLGVALPAFGAAQITMTTLGAGTVNSADQKNLSGGSVTCVFTQTAHTGSPSSTMSIQGKDPGGSGLYYTLITSAAISSDNAPTAVAAGKGVQAVTNVSSSLPVPTAWRAAITVAGSATPIITGTVGCVVN